MQLVYFNGKIKKEKQITLDIPANGNLLAFNQSLQEWANAESKKSHFLIATLKDKAGNLLAENLHYFVPTKNLQLPETEIRYKTKTSAGKCEITLSSPRLAKDVFIQIPIQGAQFSDNFFDLLPGEKRTIVISAPEITKGHTPEITIKHIRDTY